MEPLKIEYLPVSELKPYERNARKHRDMDVDAIVKSIEKFGFDDPIGIWSADNLIVEGHGRLMAAKKLGMKTVPCIRLDHLTDEQRRAYALAHNKTAENSEWDLDILPEELESIVDIDMSAFGFDVEERDKDEPTEDDYDEEPPKEPRTQVGDIYQMGNHRLICGDSTESETFERLMQGKKAACVVTSPPYGVGKDYEEKGIEPWKHTMMGVIDNITKYAGIIVWNLGDLYATESQYIEPTSFYSHEMFGEKGFKPIWIRIWKKQGMNFGVGPYHLVTNKPVQQYEYISAFQDSSAPIDAEEFNDDQYWWLSAYANSQFRFVKRLTREERKKWGYAGIWEINTVKANKEHPAMFPVELPWRCIKMHSDVGDIVIEPFCGSGTTMIACEQTRRICYAVERDPKYCDLTVDRWEKFTGEKAVLLND
jgi:DNA modification methylase